MWGGSCISAASYSAIEFGWLPCCPPKVSIGKTAKLDSADPTVVQYTITVKNNANDTMAVTLTDRIPTYMGLLQASIEPNKYDTPLVEWVLPDLGPNEVATIEYTARATRDGGYLNAVHLDANAVTGEGSDTADAAAYVDIRGTGSAPKTSRYGGGWQPPDWHFTSPDEGVYSDFDPAFDLDLVTYDGTGTDSPDETPSEVTPLAETPSAAAPSTAAHW
jgi:uncharacterized repeat protein (TIGR01451 family)